MADADGMPVFEHFPKRNIDVDRDEDYDEARNGLSRISLDFLAFYPTLL